MKNQTIVKTDNLLSKIRSIVFDFSELKYHNEYVKNQYSLQIKDEVWLDFEFEIIKEHTSYESMFGKPKTFEAPLEIFVYNILLSDGYTELPMEYEEIKKAIIERTKQEF